MADMKVPFMFILCFGAALSVTPSMEIPLYGYMFLQEAIQGIVTELGKNCNITQNGTEVDIGWSVTKCLEESVSDQSICQTFEDNIERCIQPFRDSLDVCLPENARDLPPAVIKTVKALIHTVCSSKGESLLELCNSCLFNFEDTENLLDNDCNYEIVGNQLSTLERVRSKMEMCQVVREAGSCMKTLVHYNCKSPVTRETFSKFYNAALTICD